MPFKVIVMVVWLSNSDGSIVAHASGVAEDQPACEPLAATEIENQADNPDLEGTTPKFSCWNASTRILPSQQKPAPGTVQL